MKADQIYAELADKLATQLETADPSKWRAPWHGELTLPRNASTDVAYQGGNIVRLLLASYEAGHEGPYWATYRQWATLGRQVSKGETATHCVRWITAKPDPAKPKQRPPIFPRGFAVFHYGQTAAADGFDGTVWEPPVRDRTVDPIPAAEAYTSGLGIVIGHGDANRAFYDAIKDRVNVPSIDTFEDAESYYATVWHEATHWTGHEKRLDRECAKRYHVDQKERAREELIAELGAAFQCAIVGVSSEPRDDHAQYLASWASLLRDEPKAFEQAASAAQKAVDHLRDRAGSAAVAA